MNETQRFIAFLRAVNVGGRSVKMDRLRTVFEDLGFERVATYIQSGNVFFDAVGTAADHGRIIESRLAEEFGFEITTVVLPVPELERILVPNPFASIVAGSDARFLVFFTYDAVPGGIVYPVRPPKEEFSVVGSVPGAVFVAVTAPPGKAGNPGAFVEKRLGIRATGRFYPTALEILETAKRE